MSNKYKNYLHYLNSLSEEIRRKLLTTLESNVVCCVFDNLTYMEASEKLGYEDGYIGDIAREIYGLVGQKHKTKVTRANLLSVLDSVMGGEWEDAFYGCHGIKTEKLLNKDVLEFKQGAILFSVSLFWKFNATNRALILKSKNPIVVSLQDVSVDKIGKTLVNLTRQRQLSGDAFLELVKILDIYLKDAKG